MRSFVEEGIRRGRREELVGGGLRRAVELAGGDYVCAYDERVLGSGDFVEQLRQENDLCERLEARPTLPQLINSVADVAGLSVEVLCQRRRRGAGCSEAKSIICYLATHRFGFSGEVVAKALGITRSGVCRAALRGEELALAEGSLVGEVEKLLNNSTTSP